jgi:hypothetical protein
MSPILPAASIVVRHSPTANLARADEAGEEPTPGGENDHGDGETQHVHLGEAPDHHQDAG